MTYKFIGTLLIIVSTTPSMAEVISVQISTKKVELITNCENINIFYQECYVDHAYVFEIDPTIDPYFLEIGDAKVRIDGQITKTGNEFRVLYNDQIFQLGEDVSSWIFDYGSFDGENKRLEVLSMGEGHATFEKSARAYIQSVSIELNRDLLIDKKDELKTKIIDLDRLIQMGQDIEKFIAVNNLLQSLANVDELKLHHSEIEDAKKNILSLIMAVADLSDDAKQTLIKIYSFINTLRIGQAIKISESDLKVIDEFNNLVSGYDGKEELVAQIENDLQRKIAFESLLSRIDEFLEANPR